MSRSGNTTGCGGGQDGGREAGSRGQVQERGGCEWAVWSGWPEAGILVAEGMERKGSCERQWEVPEDEEQALGGQRGVQVGHWFALLVGRSVQAAHERFSVFL